MRTGLLYWLLKMCREKHENKKKKKKIPIRKFCKVEIMVSCTKHSRRPPRSGFNTCGGNPSNLNPIPTRGGTLCPPPQVHFLKYLRNALSYGLETFWQFKWIKLKNKNLFFNRLRPPLVTIATFKVDACFEKRISAVFMPKLTRTRCFLLLPWRMAKL